MDMKMEMTVELRDKIINQLNIAYRHFGMDDDEEIALRIQENLEDLYCDESETIVIDEINIEGMLVDVAIECTDVSNVIQNAKEYLYKKNSVVRLLVTEEDTKFVVCKYDSYIPFNWVGQDIYENECYSYVAIQDISGDYWTL
jgi:hypothetical protein